MATPPSCPPGYGPDVFMRFPLEPFFTEPPYAQDCEFSFLAYNLYGGVTLALCVFGLFLHLATLCINQEKNRLSTLIRLLHCVMLALMCAVLITGWISPAHVYIPTVVYSIAFMLNGLVWSYFGYRTVVLTVVKVQLRKEVTVFTLLGGVGFVGIFVAVTLLSNVGAICGGIALIVYRSRGDIPATMVSFRIFTASISLACGVFAFAAMMALSKFITMVDSSIRSDQGKRESRSNNDHGANLKDVLKRFRLVRRTFVTSATAAAILFALHATVLPLFWYLELMSIGTSAACTVGLLFGMTPPGKRQHLRRQLLLCGRCCGDQRAETVIRDSGAVHAIVYGASTPLQEPEPRSGVSSLHRSNALTHSQHEPQSNATHSSVGYGVVDE